MASESGAYTVACIDLRTFQEELPHYIALKTKHMFTLDAATPKCLLVMKKGGLEVALLLMPKPLNPKP